MNIIIVVGAGIGRLAFALSAHRLGLSVQLYESVTNLLPRGVGIQSPAETVPTAFTHERDRGIDRILPRSASRIPTTVATCAL